MRAQFVMSEIGTGLRRNLTMTIAVVVSVALSLALAGAALLLRDQVNSMKGYWYDKVEVSIYFCNKSDVSYNVATCHGAKSTTQQVNAVKSELLKSPLVEKVYYESQEQAYVHFKQQFPNSPLSSDLTPDQLQQSLRVKLKDPAQYGTVTQLVSGQSGVANVQDQRVILQPLFNLLNGLQLAALVVMLIMFAVALLLIVNTVRVSAFSRRRETGIMRLVGASNFYVQVPFIAEAAFAAVLGAVLASALLAVAKYFLIDNFLSKQIQLFQFIGWGPFFQVVPLLLVIGVAMSGVAAALTLRKYLRV
ncbi:permease-like cell division protein FtsX [Phaeacidiphilus oryzae]|uniref:permease-like cell division protein FtsX n=1 Tax=Phaeacidiphilus oryzae TaxID=348818 RepID=UPI000568E8A1|nr:permease-like cell division protein FtsX [Phaeacidiphilus oryzae]